MFTNDQECLQYMNGLDGTKKLFLILSGSLGKDFVPRVYDRQQIRSIYIFCRITTVHKVWTKGYPKINGVFDQITELRHVLAVDKQQLESEQVGQFIMDPLINLSPSFSNSKQLPDTNEHGNNDEHSRIVNLNQWTISFDDSSDQSRDIDRHVACSNTVAPYTPRRQHMEFPDNGKNCRTFFSNLHTSITGIWPCVCVIASSSDELVRHLHSVIYPMQYFNSLESFLQHFKDHSVDPHMVVISNPINMGYVNRLMHSRVRKLYIHCSNDRLEEYDGWRNRYPQLISVLLHIDSLTQSILWELSACIIDIGTCYTRNNHRNLAQKRYQYACRLHWVIDRYLGKQNETTECSQPTMVKD